MRIAYDARLSLRHYRGMGRYLRMLIAGREHDLLGLCAAGESDPNLSLVARGPGFYPLWEQFCVPRVLHEREADVYLAPYNTAPLLLPARTRLVLVVHDLIFMEPMPLSQSLYQNAGRLYRRLVAPRAMRRADIIITVSAYTARQIALRFGVNVQRLRIIPNSIDSSWFADPAEPRERAKVVLAVAGEAPSKNLRRALAAFARCSQRMNPSRLAMKVAGVKPRFHAGFRRYAEGIGIGPSVEFLPYLSEPQMQRLYREADALLMPSIAEGFGIPVLEAMASGVPVASSHASSLPEVGGNAALYFDPLSIDEMASVLQCVMADGAMRAQMSKRGRIQASRYDPFAIRDRIESFWREIGVAAGYVRASECTA